MKTRRRPLGRLLRGGEMDRKAVEKAIKEAIDRAKERKFLESVEIAINLKNVDLSKPQNRIDEAVFLPNGTGKPRKVAVFARGETALKAKEGGADLIISPEDIDELAKDKKVAKKMANEYHFFLAEAPLMPDIGKKLGPVLGPRGKMPTPIPPLSDPGPLINRLKSSVKIRTRDKPTFHAIIGTRDMDVEKLAENADEIIKRVESKLEDPNQNIKSIFVKTTMGPAIRVV